MVYLKCFNGVRQYLPDKLVFKCGAKTSAIVKSISGAIETGSLYENSINVRNNFEIALY